jgi:hypothetical protein
VLKWVISFAFNRIFALIVIVILVRTFGASNFEAVGSLEAWIARLLPFEEIGRAMR